MDNKNNDELDSSINKRKVFHLQINKNDSSLKKFFLVLFSYIDTLIVLNLFFIVFSLGIITFGPTLLSISESIIKITKDNEQNRECLIDPAASLIPLVKQVILSSFDLIVKRI